MNEAGAAVLDQAFRFRRSAYPRPLQPIVGRDAGMATTAPAQPFVERQREGGFKKENCTPSSLGELESILEWSFRDPMQKRGYRECQSSLEPVTQQLVPQAMAADRACRW
jgi:hypothetical protein